MKMEFSLAIEGSVSLWLPRYLSNASIAFTAVGVRSSRVTLRQSGTLLLECSDADDLVRETWPGDAVVRDSVQGVVVVVVLLLYVNSECS